MSFPLISAIGGLASAGLNYYGQHEANRANMRIAREQQNFQEMMSNSAYTRAMADMKNAGLNPILAASLGGASSPPGATARMENELSPAVTSALDYRRMVAEVENLQALNERIRSETKLNKSQERITDAKYAGEKATSDMYQTMLGRILPYLDAGSSAFGLFSKLGSFSKSLRPKLDAKQSNTPKFSKSDTVGYYNKTTGEIYDY